MGHPGILPAGGGWGGGPLPDGADCFKAIIEVDLARDRVEAVAQMGTVLGDQVHQGVHHSIKMMTDNRSP